MSLNWDARKTAAWAAIKDDDDPSYTQHQTNVLDTLIWATLVVDLPGIPTAEDADEMLFRLRFCEVVGNYEPTIPDLDTLESGLTADDVEQRDGKWFSKATGQRAWKTGDDGDVWYARTDRPLTRDDMDEWVGLTTNVSRKTRHQFVTKVAKQVRDDVERRVARELADAKETADA